MRTATATRPPTRRVVGVVPLDERAQTIQRRATLALVVTPLLGLGGAVWMLWGHGLSAGDLVISFVMYAFTGFGIAIGFHRLFTHRSFVARPRLRVVLAIAGSMALQGSVISWVAAHRRHHAYSDTEGDPHSPHLDQYPGFRGVIKGLWHAHVGWLFDPDKTSTERWAPDLLKEDAIVGVDHAFPWLIAVSFVLPAILGFAASGSLRGAFTALLWGGLVRVALLHHVTWSINSICHFYGRRPYQSNDRSTNNWPLSLISFGESWHNNHHAFPSSARLGIDRGQIDVSAALISLFERLRWASDVRTVSAEQRAAKRL